jgi:hypothetical protein
MNRAILCCPAAATQARLGEPPAVATSGVIGQRTIVRVMTSFSPANAFCFRQHNRRLWMKN